MSEAEDPSLRAKDADGVSVEDVRKLMGASTPHFALQLRNRIRRLIEPLPIGNAARIEGEREIARLDALGLTGEHRGHRAEAGLATLSSAPEPPAAA